MPTNLELAAQADTVVVATVTGETKGKQVWDGTVLTKPTTLLKGSALPPMIELRGAYLATNGQRLTHSDPRELRQPNPDALTGGCVRYVFAKDMQLLLFLKRDEQGQLKPWRSSFSRDAEDVSGTDALWVKAIREYVTIGASPRSEWKKRLRERIAQIRARPIDADSSAIADDLTVEYRGKRLPPVD